MLSVTGDEFATSGCVVAFSVFIFIFLNSNYPLNLEREIVVFLNDDEKERKKKLMMMTSGNR